VYGYRNDSCVQRYLCKACVAYDSGEKTYILVFDQCFVDKDLTSSLICPNQLRANGVEVNDVPKRYDKKSSHSIVVGNLIIPLESKGYVSYFPVRAPTDQEISTLEHVEMTGEVWDPYSSDDHETLERAAVSGVGRAFTHPVDPSYLAKLWSTTTEITEATLKCTTLLASKVYSEPRISSYGHRFRYLTRKHLKGRFWTDTFFAKKSTDGFTCAQLFNNRKRIQPIVRKLYEKRAEGTRKPQTTSVLQHISLYMSSINGDNLANNKYWAWAVIGTSFIGTVGLTFPFVWMQLKSPLPYMSTPRRKVLAALEEISIRRGLHGNDKLKERTKALQYFDLGSGDGETVLAAASLPGWDATGIELNYTLWSISNMRRFTMGASQLLFPRSSSQNIFPKCRFRWDDFWNVCIEDADAVMIFGVTPMMPRIADKIRKECKPGTFVLAYRFRLPIGHPMHQHGNVSERDREQSKSDQNLNASLIYDKDEMRIYQILGDRNNK
jgi:hypothetical protein